MSHYYVDSSALVKRYVTELGSEWVVALTDPSDGHTVIVAEITRVEVAAALAARHRATGGLTRQERDDAVDLLHHHYDTEYQSIPTTPVLLDRAVRLTQNHRLRGYDAVQLATALLAHERLVAAELTGLIFTAADHDLVAAAQAEGLATENPNDHQ
jgi:predicted nucleic acid-binding protein